MAGFVSYTSFDYKPVNIVPVIASFDSEGNIVPLYARINGESYKIASHWVSSTFSNSLEYKCKVIDGDSLKPLSLTYYRNEGVWTIPK